MRSGRRTRRMSMRPRRMSRRLSRRSPMRGMSRRRRASPMRRRRSSRTRRGASSVRRMRRRRMHGGDESGGPTPAAKTWQDKSNIMATLAGKPKAGSAAKQKSDCIAFPNNCKAKNPELWESLTDEERYKNL